MDHFSNFDSCLYRPVNGPRTRINMEQFYDDIKRAMANSDPNYKIRETERESKVYRGEQNCEKKKYRKRS